MLHYHLLLQVQQENGELILSRVSWTSWRSRAISIQLLEDCDDGSRLHDANDAEQASVCPI